jgi:LmbE family N-acetylglucosaminyl deacetylase
VNRPSRMGRAAETGWARFHGARWIGRGVNLSHSLSAPVRRLLVARAKNITESVKAGNTLVLAPHPDDETLGCGGTIALKRELGSRVTVCIATRGTGGGRRSTLGDQLPLVRAEETQGACRRLGVDAAEIRWLGHDDSTLERHADSLLEPLCELINEVDPAQLFVPFFVDAHNDHRTLFTAALSAVARIRSPAAVYAYPVWFWTRAAWVRPSSSPIRRAATAALRAGFSPVLLRPRVVNIEDFLGVKCEALDFYSGEFASFPLDFLDDFTNSYELFFEVTPRSLSWRDRVLGLPIPQGCP